MFTIHIKNFQSFEEAELEVHGLTVITGSNDVGKTATHRAVFGAFTNPRGTKYVRHGKPHCSVRVDFGDGRSVLWEKGEKVNRYTLDGRVLENVGAGVPKEIESLGVVPISLTGDRKIWPQFAHQFTGSVFLLDQPGSVMAEAIADVDRVGVLNEALRLSQSDHRAAGSERKVRQADVVRLEAQEREFLGLDTMDSHVLELERLEGEIQAHRDSIRSLKALRDRIASLDTTILELTPIRDVEIPQDLSRLGKMDAAYQWILGMAEKLVLATKSVDSHREAGVEIAKIRLPDPPAVGSYKTELQTLQGFRSNARALGEALVKLRDVQKTLDADVAQADRELTELRGSVKECPTCGALSLHEHEP